MIRFFTHCLVLFCTSILCFSGFAEATEDQFLKDVSFTEEENTQLAAGNSVIRAWKDESYGDGAADVFGGIDIEAPANVIWPIMLDCDRVMDLISKMKQCEVLESSPDGLWDIRVQKLRISALLPKSVSEFRSDYDWERKISFSKTGGNMKIQYGYWALEPLDAAKTRVTYRARVRPKFPVPGGILRNGMRKDVPEILGNLKRESETDYANEITQEGVKTVE